MFPGSSPITSPLLLPKHIRSKGPSLRRRYPASSLIRPSPTPADDRHPYDVVRVATSVTCGSPPITQTTLWTCRAHYPGGSVQVHLSVASLTTRPSPFPGGVGIRNFTFEACSSFTHVTACPVAHQPSAGFVTRLQSNRLPNRTACQLTCLTDIYMRGTCTHW